MWCSRSGQDGHSDWLLPDETLPLHGRWGHRLDQDLQTGLCDWTTAALPGRVSLLLIRSHLIWSLNKQHAHQHKPSHHQPESWLCRDAGVCEEVQSCCLSLWTVSMLQQFVSVCLCWSPGLRLLLWAAHRQTWLHADVFVYTWTAFEYVFEPIYTPCILNESDIKTATC